MKFLALLFPLFFLSCQSNSSKDQAVDKAYKAEKGVDKRLEMYALFNEQ